MIRSSRCQQWPHDQSGQAGRSSCPRRRSYTTRWDTIALANNAQVIVSATIWLYAALVRGGWGAGRVAWRVKFSEFAWPLSLCVVASFFAAQAFRYSGIVYRFGEWQFNGLDVYYPGMTALMLMTLVMIPVLLILLALRRRKRGRVEGDIEQIYRNYIAATTATIHGLYFIAVAAAIAMVACLVVPFASDSEGRAARAVDIAERLTADDLPSRLSGRIDSRHIALLRQGIALARHDVYVAPLIVDGTSAARLPQRYFAEIAATDLDSSNRGFAAGNVTYLRRAALPPQLVTLFRNHGIDVAPQPIMLFTSRQSRDWPYYITAVQLLIVALLAALVARIFQWRRRRLADHMAGLAFPVHRIMRR